MRRRLIAAALAAAAGAAAAGDGGFSYVMGLGRQDFRYRETGSTLPFESDVKSGGPLLVTGALYELEGGHLFSLDSESTFYPGHGTETWRSTAPVFNGVSLSDRTLQSNGFSLRQTHTQLAGHWRASPSWFASGGLAMRTLSFKRYSFVVGPDGAVSVPAGTTVEESASEVLASLGAAYESGPLRERDTHVGLRFAVAKPVWRRLENTSQPEARFDSTAGWDVSLAGRASLAVMRNVHLGAWAQWTLAQRGAQTQGSTLELPRNRLESRAIGLELLWKL